MSLHSAFSGKCVFFTGVTGFVGKVFLYLLLKNFPDMKRVYALIRTKKNQSPQERFVKEVASSQCFEPLRKEVGEEEWKRRLGLVVAVSGDITEDFLGINETMYKEMTENVNFIAHIAATVDFQEKLNLAIQMNALGPLRVLALAHKCKNLEAMIHTSTCYVNWTRSGQDTPVKEQLYPLPFEPEAMVKYVLSIHERHIPKETATLLEKYRFPNTYTFSKSIGEHLIRLNKGKLPVAIVRPAIIGASYRDPAPGWVDALTAAGGLFLTVGLGIVGEFKTDPKLIADVVPVDHVCSVIIKALYKTSSLYKAAGEASLTATSVAQVDQKAVLLVTGKHPVAPFATTAVVPGVSATFEQTANSQPLTTKAESTSSDVATIPFVYHAATSDCMNRLTWQLCKEVIEEYWNSTKRHPRAISKAYVLITKNPILFYSKLYFQRTLPVMMMKFAANLPAPVGSEHKRKLVGKLERALARAAEFRGHFLPFVDREWIYDQTNVRMLDEGLSAQAASAFPSDPYTINWWTYIQLYNYGMLKFIVKSPDPRGQPVVPVSGSEALLKASL